MRWFPRFGQKFISDNAVPGELQDNFRRLYLDMVFIGILNGSTLAFLNIYAARIGATSQQIGWITASPAIVALALTLPTGQWLNRHRHGRAVFWSAAIARIFYAPMIFIPAMIFPAMELTLIILLVFVSSFPFVILVLGFNVLFADTVPPDWRGHVAGFRSAAFAIATAITTLICGVLLKNIAFPYGYQVVFLIGFLGASLSTAQLWSLRPLQGSSDQSATIVQLTYSSTSPGNIGNTDKANKLLRFDVLKGSYGRIILMYFLFHLFQYLPIPLFPIYSVNTLLLSDQAISIGTACFYLSIFLLSPQINRMVYRYGNHKIASIGMTLLSLYPFFMIFSYSILIYAFTNFIGGLAFALINVTQMNYLFEKAPDHDRPAYLAWYNLILNAAILLGSFCGPLVSNVVGMTAALVLFGLGRLLVGISIFGKG